MRIPAEFVALGSRGPTWPDWLAALPRLVRDILDEWDLTVDGAAVHGECAMVVPVTTPAREPAVVKFGWPHPEAEHEHLALRAWQGRAVVRLIRADPRRAVMLLERAGPADLTTLGTLQACEVVASLYADLHLPAMPQLRLLSDQAARWSQELRNLPASAPVPHRYVEQAAALAADFAADPATDGRLIHTDLHYVNVLAAQREPWLVIDPKPLSGDPAYEVAPLLWNRWDEVASSGDARATIRRRFHTVVDVAGFDEDRARDWVVVRELVNVLWTLRDPAGQAQEQQEFITNALVVAKAVQE